MDIEKVNMFIAAKGEYFPAEAIPMIRERLLKADPDSELAIMSLSYISPVLNIVLSVFFGEFGIDRFIIGDVGLGIGKLLTTYCCDMGNKKLAFCIWIFWTTNMRSTLVFERFVCIEFIGCGVESYR